MVRNNKGQFVTKPLSECPYKGREKEYKREWYLKNKERLQKQQQERYQENKERYNFSTKLWQMKNAEKVRIYKRKNKDKIRFDGNREDALKRDNYQCQVCESSKSLVVHHLDETENRIKMNANNTLENLITLCRSCHLKTHKYKLKI